MAQNWIPPLIEITPEEEEKYVLTEHSDFIRKTNFTYHDKPVWVAWVTKGDMNSGDQIDQSGDLLSGVDQFLGIASGVILRQIGQIHNINAVNDVGYTTQTIDSHEVKLLNNSEQHLSIIYKDGDKIKYYFNGSGAYDQFMRRPFRALILVTKSTTDGE